MLRRLRRRVCHPRSSVARRTLSTLLRFPRVIDFDNKRAFFKFKVKQLGNRNAGGGPMRITVRRDHAFEDSFHQVGYLCSPIALPFSPVPSPTPSLPLIS